MGNKRKSKRSCLTNAQAIERLHIIFEKVRRDYSHALRVECSMESANEVVCSLARRDSAFSSAYNAALDSMKFDLSVSLARLLDNSGVKGRKFGRSPNNKDIASAPFLMRLLKQKRCRRFLSANNPDIEKTIEEALADYSRELCSPSARQVRRKLKSFRNHALAHSLIVEPDLRNPRFNELFDLVLSLGKVVSNLSLVVDQEEWDIDSEREVLRYEAMMFWSKAFLSELDDL